MKTVFTRFFSIMALFIAFYTPTTVAHGKFDPTPQLQTAIDNYLQVHGAEEGMSAITLAINAPGLPQITVMSGCKKIPSTSCIPLASNDLYQIGSITKSFISVILLQIEATPNSGFNINDSLSKYFPEYPQWGAITVKQLLNMTSGIHSFNDTDTTFWPYFVKHLDHQFSQRDLVNYVVNDPLLFSPGTAWSYSNTNYILAGMLVEKLTGHSLESEINTRILKPLDLQNTYYVPNFYPQYTPHINKRMVHGYVNTSDLMPFIPLGTDATWWSLSEAGAAGAMISTPGDVVKWAQALYTSTTLLPPSQRQELETLVSTNTGQPISAPTSTDEGYGLGIGADTGPGGDTMYDYVGGMPGYLAFYIYYPNENISISVTVNSISDNWSEGDLINQVYEIITGSTTLNALANKKFTSLVDTNIK